jgi:hypothetical protein
MSTAAADASLADVRGRRNRLAVAIRGALMELERHPAAAFPLARQEQRAHEENVLGLALAALLAPPPEVEHPTGSIEHSLQEALQELAA